MNNRPELDPNDILVSNIIDNSKKMIVPVGVLSTALKDIDANRKQRILTLIPNDVLISLYNAHPNELPLILEHMGQEKLAEFLADFLRSKSVDECVAILHFCYGVFTTNIAYLCEQISSEVFYKLVLSSNKINLSLFCFLFQKLDETPLCQRQ